FERKLGSENPVFTALRPSSFNSSNGTVLMLQSDGSLLAAGPRPEKDTYVISAETQEQAITAVRLDVLTDPTLPHQGPGRQDNGNLHLSEFRVLASSAESVARPVALQQPTADFDQQAWTIVHAIDGNQETAWGIYPEVGTNHYAVFELKENLGFAKGT